MTKPSPRFYIFHGEDDLGRSEMLDDFKSRIGPEDTTGLNTLNLDGSRVSLSELRHACDAIPFLAKKRLVIVHDLLKRLSTRGGALSADKKDFIAQLEAYLPALPDTTRLVFVEDKTVSNKHPLLKLAQRDPHGYVKQFDPPDSKSLPRWIEARVQKYGGEIENRAAHQLAAVVDSDLRILDQEITKLVTYTNQARAITVEDIDRLVPYAQAAIVFDMVDALGRRDGRTAAQTLHRLLDEGEHPLGLLAMIVRQFRLLIQVDELKSAGATSKEIARKLKIHPFPARKLYGQADYFSSDQLRKVYHHLLDTDVAIKCGQIEAETALDLLVAGLANK